MVKFCSTKSVIITFLIIAVIVFVLVVFVLKVDSYVFDIKKCDIDIVKNAMRYHGVNVVYVCDRKGGLCFVRNGKEIRLFVGKYKGVKCP